MQAIRILVALGALSALLSSGSAQAQSYDLSWNKVAGGGSTFLTGGSFSLGATSGQADATTVAMTGGSFTLTGGFWVAAVPVLVPGDLNCDGVINNFDIDPFVLALTDPAAYAASNPGCDIMNGDINGDGSVNNFDIDAFVALLTGG